MTLIVGIVVGSIVLVAIIVSIVAFLIIRKKRMGDPIEKEKSIEATFGSGVIVSSMQNFENPLYGEDYHDSRDPFNEPDFDEDL